MANYNLVITNVGLAAARNVVSLGYKVNIEQVKIGDALVNPESAEVLEDIVGEAVFDSDTGVENIKDILTCQLTGASGVQFRLYLDSRFGDFVVGNIGLYITDPLTNMRIMFAIGCLNKQIDKLAKTNENSGNSFKFYLNTQLSGVANILNMETRLLNEALIPTVDTEENLPAFGTQMSNCYEILNYAGTGQIALAVAGDELWEYIQPSTNVIFASEDSFDSSVGQYDTVYWDNSTGKYKKGDGKDETKGVLGIRVGNNIVIGGYIINPGAYVANTRYYADGGANAGKLTTTQTLTYVGEATTNNILLLGLDTRGHATTSIFGTVQTATAAEVSAATNNTKYVTPKDLGTYYPHRAKDETVTGKWTFTEPVVMSGDVKVDTGATMDLTGNLSVGGTTTLNDGLSVTSGNTVLNGDLTVTGDTSIVDFHSTGNGIVDGTLTVGGATTINSTLNVSGKSTLGQVSAGNTAITGTLSTSGKATLNSLGVTGNATVGGTMGITGATTIGGTLGVTGNTTLSTATVNNALTCKSTLSTTGDATFGEDVVINGTLTVKGKSTLAATDITGTTNISGVLNCSNSGTFTGSTYSAGGTWTFTNTIQGTCYRALWADLAELYEADDIYEAGTLVQFGGSSDITIATTEVNAVISTDPGMILGSSDSPFALPIALVGRVPVRVIGTLSRGDQIVLSETAGVARKYNSKTDKTAVIIGKALENKEYEEIGKVLCVTKFSL